MEKEHNRMLFFSTAYRIEIAPRFKNANENRKGKHMSENKISLREIASNCKNAQ